MADGDVVTVAIPVRDGERYLAEVLGAVGGQRVDRELEVLVVDSGSSDRSVEIARDRGARVESIDRAEFSHGGTRNLMMELARGAHVAFLTQDATPTHDRWLAKLIEGFDVTEDVALVFGPYVPRPGASHTIEREFRDFFDCFSPNGRPSVQRISEALRSGSYRRSPGILTYFTDANGCVARWAWQKVPYRNVGFAEDQLIAAEMIEAGYAKVFQPNATVRHSHDYSSVELLRRFFDEWRGLREVYGHVEPARPRQVIGRIRQETRHDRQYLRETRGASGVGLALGTLESIRYQSFRALGSIAGSRADRLPATVRRLLSLEGRAGFEQYDRASSTRTDGEATP
jgi:GT2 family glycosyltransferase